MALNSPSIVIPITKITEKAFVNVDDVTLEKITKLSQKLDKKAEIVFKNLGK